MKWIYLRCQFHPSIIKDGGEGRGGSFSNKFFINSILICLWFLFLLLIVLLLNTPDKREKIAAITQWRLRAADRI